MIMANIRPSSPLLCAWDRVVAQPAPSCPQPLLSGASWQARRGRLSCRADSSRQSALQSLTDAGQLDAGHEDLHRLVDLRQGGHRGGDADVAVLDRKSVV